MKYGFGIDIGGTTVKIAFFDCQGELLEKWEIKTDTENGGENILSDIASAIKDYLEEKQILQNQIIGIGIGVPGPVDDSGIVNGCVNLGWGSVNIQEELSALTGYPVKVGNDANVAALGECWRGAARGHEDIVLATLGTGIGGGVVVKGKVVNGTHGAGGEIGHITLNPDEQETCGCGKYGCAEQYCSATGVVRVAKRYLEENADASILRDLQNLECRDVFDAAEKGDKAAEAILEQVYRYLGLFLANICCVTDPDVILLGGGVSKAGEPLISGTMKYFKKYAFHACKDTEILIAELGNDAGAYGAWKLALDAFGKES
ncbi:MAG: ROK family glucokinase [Anaerotignum sp.]|nr:ROK family glucokinase [Anaerotignum sp.]